MDSDEARLVIERWKDAIHYPGAFFMTELTGGFTDDVLWHVESVDDRFKPFIARFFDSERATCFAEVYRVLETCEESAFPTNRPLLLELPDEGANWGGMAYSYIRGTSMERTLATHDEATAARLGWRAGELLHRFHRLDLPTLKTGEVVRKAVLKYERYQNLMYRMHLSYAGQNAVENFIEDCLGRMAAWPVSRVHDDFHPRNLIEHEGHIVGVIDFDRMDDDDPIQDLRKIPWFTEPLSRAFACAQLQSFAEQAPQADLWQRYNLYVAMSFSSSLVWQARREDRGGLAAFQQRILEIVNTHDFENAGPPSWYDER